MNSKPFLALIATFSIGMMISGCGSRDEATWVLVVDGRAERVLNSTTSPPSDGRGAWKRVPIDEFETRLEEQYASIDLDATIGLKAVVVWRFDDPAQFAIAGLGERVFRREYLPSLLSASLFSVLVGVEEQILLGSLQPDTDQIEQFARNQLEYHLKTETIMGKEATDYFGFVIEKIDITASLETI